MRINYDAYKHWYSPVASNGKIRVYDPAELVAAKMISDPETYTTPSKFYETKHPGWCYMSGCPQAKQVNGSLICRYHAKRLGRPQ